MPDYPSSEGYTAAQLKTAFDSSAVGLKADLNGLMTELENTDSASNIGASAVTSGDISEANVQAKLEYIMEQVQGAVLGDIPDGTITQAKMNATYEETIAKKDSTLQTGLNAEMLGGTTLATLMAAIGEHQYSVGTYTITKQSGQSEGSTTSLTLNLGFQPKCVLLVNRIPSSHDGGMKQWSRYKVVIAIGSVGIALASSVSYSNAAWYHEMTPTLTSTGITIPGFGIGNYSGTQHQGSYIAFK